MKNAYNSAWDLVSAQDLFALTVLGLHKDSLVLVKVQFILEIVNF